MSGRSARCLVLGPYIMAISCFQGHHLGIEQPMLLIRWLLQCMVIMRSASQWSATHACRHVCKAVHFFVQFAFMMCHKLVMAGSVHQSN